MSDFAEIKCVSTSSVYDIQGDAVAFPERLFDLSDVPSISTSGSTKGVPIRIDGTEGYVPWATSVAKFDYLTATPGTITASKAVVVDSAKAISGFRNITFDTSGALATHPLVFSSITLADNTNVIRGTSVNPTRTSGWISFSGTVGATPAQVYTDYRELHTTGVAEVLGAGFFPFMDSGASCASMFAVQAICEVDAGSTVLTAGGAPAVGIFPIFAKCLLNGETFNSGGVAAAIFASVQANVTDVSSQNVSVFNIENASGNIKDIFYLKATSGYWRNFFTFAAEQSPVLAWGADASDCSGAPTKGLRCMVGASEYWIPMYINT